VNGSGANGVSGESTRILESSSSIEVGIGPFEATGRPTTSGVREQLELERHRLTAELENTRRQVRQIKEERDRARLELDQLQRESTQTAEEARKLAENLEVARSGEAQARRDAERTRRELGELRDELARLRSNSIAERSAMDRERESVRERIEQLRGERDEAQAGSTHAEALDVAWAAERETQARERGVLESEVARVAADRDRLLEELDAARRGLSEAEVRNTRLQSDHDEGLALRTRLEGELRNRVGEIERLVEAQTQRRRDQEQAQSRLKRLQSELEATISERDGLDLALADLKRSNDAVAAELKKVGSEYRRQCDERNALAADRAKLLAEVKRGAELREKLQKLEAENAKGQTERTSNLAKWESEKNQLQAALAKAKQAAHDSATRIGELEPVVQRLSSELAGAHDRNRTLEEEHAALATRASELEERADSERSRAVRAIETAERHARTMSELEAERDQLRQEQGELAAGIEQVNKESRGLIAERDELLAARQAMAREQSQQESSLAAAHSERDALASRVSNLSDELENTKRESAMLETELDNAWAEMERRGEELEVLGERLRSVDGERERYSDRVAEIQAELANAREGSLAQESRLVALDREREDLLERVRNAESDRGGLVNARDELTRVMEASRIELDQARRIASELADQEERLSQAQHDLLKAREEVEALRSEKSEWASRWAMRERDHGIVEAELRRDKVALRRLLDAERAAVKTALAELDTAQQLADQAEAQFAEAQRRGAAFEAVLRKYRLLGPGTQERATAALPHMQGSGVTNSKAAMAHAQNQVRELTLQLNLVRAEYERLRQVAEAPPSEASR
jgi:chromosome segregation ATPase